MKIFQYIFIILTAIIHSQYVRASDLSLFSGHWKYLEKKSERIPLFGSVSIDIKSKDDTTTLFFTWGSGSRVFRDTLYFRNVVQKVSWKSSSRVFPYNVFLGIKVAENQCVAGEVKELSGQLIEYERTYDILGSQGKKRIKETNRLSLSRDGNILKYTVSIPELFGEYTKTYTFKRKGYHEAWVAYLSDNWKIDGSLDVQVLLLSIQGLVNRTGPGLYFVYPDNWDYRFTKDILHFLEDEKNYSFTEVKSVKTLLDTFRNVFSGYVVWDKSDPVTLDAAFTVAGLQNAIVVSEDMIPFAKSEGLTEIKDFRGVFSGMTDAEVFKILYDEYSVGCNKNMIVWLGGESGEVMKPGIADWGIMNRAFFTNLSTDPLDTAEYLMAGRIMQGQTPFGIIFGWHVYKKDKERDHVKLASSYGLRVEGLHTLPNMSFMHHIPVSGEFRFTNHHSSDKLLSGYPGKKVYLSFVQTDCLGLGAWNQPGRGTLQYAWEVTMNWYWLAPAMLEYFYSEATEKDYFIGSLSGPGYIYPKAVPDKYLPSLLDSAYDLMKKLDLNVFEIMDYSEGATIEGNTELSRKVVETYYKHMPDATGFINGYAPAFTFYSYKGRPLISYDYYLDPGRTVDEAIADIRSLVVLNDKRPYFLLVHVRQWNNIDKVNKIVSGLGDKYEVISLDVFLKMAGKMPTFRNQFLEE